MTDTLKAVLFGAAILATTVVSILQPTYASPNVADPFGIIPGGYDPVAYLEDGKAVRGKARFSYVLDGQIYVFATRAHRDRFILDPQVYLTLQ